MSKTMNRLYDYLTWHPNVLAGIAMGILTAGGITSGLMLIAL